MNTDLMFSTGKDDWQTPPEIFGPLHEEFGFTLDLAANAENHLLPEWLGPGSPIAEDALTYRLHEDERCWLNPPYSRNLQPEFVRKVAMNARQRDITTVALLPARTDTRMFHDWIWNVEEHRPRPWVREVRFLKGRVKFVGAKSSAPFPSMVVVFG